MVEIDHVSYGPASINDQTVLANIRSAIENHGTFDVRNENLGGDPQPGVQKRCAIRWRDYQGGPLIMDTITEGDRFNFRHYIKKITYGDSVIMDKPDVYNRLHQAWKARDGYDEARKWNPFAGMKDQQQVTLNNDNLGGDPKPGVVKEVIIELSVSDYHEEESWFRYDEGDNWPPRSVDHEQYVDDNIASQALGQLGSSMMATYSSY